jgi:hypothetical protein
LREKGGLGGLLEEAGEEENNGVVVHCLAGVALNLGELAGAETTRRGRGSLVEDAGS